MSNSIKNIFKKGKVIISKEDYALLISKRIIPDAFAIINSNKGISIVIEQSKIKDSDIIDKSKVKSMKAPRILRNMKLITFDIPLTPDMVGFVAMATKAFKNEKVSAFVYSALGTDYFLIFKKDILNAKKAIKKLGCIIEEK